MQRRSLFVLALFVAAAVLGATTYRWVDEKGVTHYSDSPPPGQKSQRIDTPPAPPPTAPERAAPPAKAWQQQDEEFRKRHEARQKQLDQEARDRQRAQELAEIQRGTRTPVPGGTLAPPGLQQHVLQMLVTVHGLAPPPCTEHRVLNTELLELNRETRAVVERWTVDRCGRTVRYRVTFTPAPQGGANVGIAPES